ncbi:hypothetical protein F511_16910 [Dorcoceras hygrometricum]|uniref:Uncharacterized protein n=1 Tax=Dorcoceras hygrometricum TaxID=472368 RepID=A0A2Z7AI43_9LAMI|nr:hypothetical protein F511_16910 [Dorcoceras hygrometricum]
MDLIGGSTAAYRQEPDFPCEICDVLNAFRGQFLFSAVPSGSGIRICHRMTTRASTLTSTNTVLNSVVQDFDKIHKKEVQIRIFHKPLSMNPTSTSSLDKQFAKCIDCTDRSFSGPRVQLIHEHSSSESTSDDTSMDFADQDTATTDLSLPSAATPYVTEALAQLRDPIDQIRERDDGAKLKDTLLMHLHDIERKFSARFDEQDRELTALLDVRREVKAMHARVDVVATGVDNVRKYVEATKEAISHQLLEFQSQAQANYIILTDQLGQLVDYINRGGNDKKGEGSSRGPQPPPVVQIRDSGITGGSDDVVRTTDISQTDIDNAQRDIMERLMREDRERERERRERSRVRRSSSYKRRRY